VKPDRVEPDLRDVLIALHVHVRRLLTIAGEEEEPVGSNAKDGRHASSLLVHGAQTTSALPYNAGVHLQGNQIKARRNP
jgi:hypothetical protein